MENLEIINEFLDGSLSATEEEQLFAQLSQSYELRTELKQQLAMQSAVKGDIKAFTPKAESTMNIFNTLGFATASATAPTFLSRMKAFYAGNSTAIFSGLISALATAIVFIILWQNGNLVSNTQIGNAESSSQIVINYDIPVVESYVPHEEFNSYRINENAPTRILYRNVNVKEENADNAEIPKNNNLNNSILRLANLNLSDQYFTNPSINMMDANNGNYNNTKYKNADYYRNRSFSANDYNFMINNPNYVSKSEFIDNFSIELSGAQYFNDIDGNMQPGQQLLFNNTNLALLYQINSQLEFAFAYTRENFYQRFRGYESQDLYEYEQNPNLSTFSTMLRYSPTMLNFGVFEPFANISFGANNIGPVLRGGVGSKAHLGLGSYVIFGLDRSIMWYEYQNALNNSGKIGFYGGIGIKF